MRNEEVKSEPYNFWNYGVSCIRKILFHLYFLCILILIENIFM